MVENQSTETLRVDLTALRRKRVFIDLGDGNKDNILELNTSDIGIVSRLTKGYLQFDELDKKIVELQSIQLTDDDSEVSAEALRTASQKLDEIDALMRDTLDYIFDSNVSEICCPKGSLYDPIDGRFRYDIIIDGLIALYSETIQTEVNKVSAQKKKHTAKYTGKR